MSKNSQFSHKNL
uniref:Uncharacterized protein n=1 Tax=Arundo donax TaxID=35708 RepID=A0A0A8ZXA6_ARUDO